MIARGALEVPAFRRLTVAWTFSNFGDSALYLTLAIWVKDLTGSNASAGLVFVFLGLPAFLAPLAGHIADRFSRRRLVMAANLIAALGVMLLAFVHGAGDVWIVYAVAFGYGLLTYLTSACASGLIRDLVADEHLAGANGLLTTIDQGLQLISPLVGVVVYATFGGVATGVVTAGSLVLAAATVSTMRIVETPPTPAADRERFTIEVNAGFRHLRDTRGLAQLTLCLAVAMAITGLATTTIFAAIEQGIGRGSAFFAVVTSAQGLGSVIGGITASLLIARLTERVTMTIGLALLAAGITALLATSTTVFLIGALAAGIAIPWTFVSYTTVRQRATPGFLQGRVSAAATLAFNGPHTIGTALGAALVLVVDYRLLVVAMVIVTAASSLLTFRTPSVAAAADPPRAQNTPGDPPRLIQSN